MSVINRSSTKSLDTWLTPLDLVRAAGPFDLDPCCPATMPWRTAKKMVSLDAKRSTNLMTKGDGLELEWRGYTLVNMPYSKPLPWVQKMVAHKNGLLVTPAKSTDSKWGHLILQTADAMLFVKSRIRFCYQNGQQSAGTWHPNLISAYGLRAVSALIDVQKLYPGVILTRVTQQTGRLGKV